MVVLAKSLFDQCLVIDLILSGSVQFFGHFGLLEVYKTAIVVEGEAFVDGVVFLEKILLVDASELRIRDSPFAT